MADEQRAAILSVAVELLLQALKLPADTKIDEVRMSFAQPGVIELRIEHPDLRPVPESRMLPRVSAQFETSHEDGEAPVTRFVRWFDSHGPLQ